MLICTDGLDSPFLYFFPPFFNLQVNYISNCDAHISLMCKWAPHKNMGVSQFSRSNELFCFEPLDAYRIAFLNQVFIGVFILNWLGLSLTSCDRPFSQQICHCGKSAGVTNKINGGCALFKCPTCEREIRMYQTRILKLNQYKVWLSLIYYLWFLSVGLYSSILTACSSLFHWCCNSLSIFPPHVSS